MRFELEGNFIGDEGAAAFSASLRTNGTLRILMLNRAGIGDVGAVALAGALEDNTALEGLFCRRNGFAVDGVGADALWRDVRCVFDDA